MRNRRHTLALLRALEDRTAWQSNFQRQFRLSADDAQRLVDDVIAWLERKWHLPKTACVEDIVREVRPDLFVRSQDDPELEQLWAAAEHWMAQEPTLKRNAYLLEHTLDFFCSFPRGQAPSFLSGTHYGIDGQGSKVHRLSEYLKRKCFARFSLENVDKTWEETLNDSFWAMRKFLCALFKEGNRAAGEVVEMMVRRVRNPKVCDGVYQ